jgi:hypothetical protein
LRLAPAGNIGFALKLASNRVLMVQPSDLSIPAHHWTGATSLHGNRRLKIAYDVWYVDNLSSWLDLRILWLTVRKVLRSEGVNQARQATMEELIGSNAKDLVTIQP